MKRLILLSTLTLLLVILIGATAFGTKARIQSLGNSDYFFKDIYHIYANPAFLGLYTNSVYGELGCYDDYYWYYNEYDEYTPTERFLGINYKVYKGLSLGLTLNRKAYMPFYWDMEPEVVSEAAQPDAQDYINEYDFMASYDFEKLHVGLGLHHEGNKSEWEDNYVVPYSPGDYTYGDEWSIGNTGLTGGFLYDIDENSCIEGMVRLNFDRYDETYKYSDTAGYWYEQKWKYEGGNGIGFSARAFYQVVENFQIVPLIMFESEKVSEKYDLSTRDSIYATEKSGDEKYTKLVIGLGGNLKLDKGMIAGGINLTKEKYTDEWDTLDVWEGTRWFKPGFNLGVEYDLTKWLVARMGMQKEFIKYEETEDDRDNLPYEYHWFDKWSSTTDPADFLSFGVGFKFSKFKVDATVGANRFFEGGYILSGRQRNLFGTMSATFEF
ncbi:MAG: hypothetical protein MUO78_09655 [candidate division Zixibacteria bacterium]|nr:hypothetical protein [candidate division Zixibacteria bacterium]